MAHLVTGGTEERVDSSGGVDVVVVGVISAFSCYVCD